LPAAAQTTPLGNPAVLTNKPLLKLILDYHTVNKATISAGSQKTALAIAPALSISKAG
jgi:hypothetical protein